jgi:hypothetical protein
LGTSEASAAELQPPARTDDASAAKQPSPAQRAAAEQFGVTLDHEAQALAFVRLHHDELLTLLDQLKADRPRDYYRAIRDLSRASEQIAQKRESDPERYALDLEAWKIQSRIQLILARMTMGTTPELEAELRQSIEDQLAIQRNQLVETRRRLAERMSQLDASIDRLERGHDAQVDRRVQALVRSVERMRAPKKDKSQRDKPTGGRPERDKLERDNADRPKQPAKRNPSPKD